MVDILDDRISSNSHDFAYSTSNSDGEASWMEHVSLEYRKKRAAIALGIGLICTGSIWALQYSNNVFFELFWIGALPLAIGAWRYRFWMALDKMRKYETITKTFTKEERLKCAGKWWVFGVAMSAAFGLVAFRMPEFVLFAILLLIGFGATGFVVFMRREETGMTAAAIEQYNLDEKEKQARENAWAAPFFAIMIKPIVRYPIAALLFWLAYHLNESPSGKTHQIVLALLLALAASYELFFWLIAIAIVVGLGSLAFTGIAAMPISLAVIVGALIIAAAVRR